MKDKRESNAGLFVVLGMILGSLWIIMFKLKDLIALISKQLEQQ